jgi:hypothetical protein
MKVSIPQRIVDFLRQHQGSYFCDDCVAIDLKMKQRQEVQTVTATLALCSGYLRIDGHCSECDPKASGRSKLVIKAN